MIGGLYIILIIFTLLVAGCIVVPLWIRRRNCRRPAAAETFTGFLIIALFFSAGFGLYQLYGNAHILPQISEREVQLQAIRKAVVGIKQEIAAAPDSIMPWIKYGLAQMELARYDAAADAFRKATLLSGGDPRILLLYAKSLTLAAGGVVTADAGKAFSMVLLQDPENAEARYFLEMGKKQRAGGS